MKLLRELTEDVSFVTEAATADKPRKLFIEGIFLQGDIKNRNGRMYPVGILEGAVDSYIKRSDLAKGGAYGELGHPQGPTINLDRASHLIRSLTREGTNYIGKAEILTGHRMGDDVAAIMEHGGRLGVSSRGLGSLVQKEGYNEVQGDFYLVTAADIVADPSAPDAFVKSVMEGTEWVWDEKQGWKALEVAEAVKKSFSQSKPSQISEDRKIAAFAAWMNKRINY